MGDVLFCVDVCVGLEPVHVVDSVWVFWRACSRRTYASVCAANDGVDVLFDFGQGGAIGQAEDVHTCVDDFLLFVCGRRVSLFFFCWRGQGGNGAVTNGTVNHI